MAVKKTLIRAIPHEKDGKVVKWDLEMKYEDGDASADPSTYYSSSYSISLAASYTSIITDVTETNFTPKAKGEWSKSDIEALFPTSRWDAVFASQYDSVITNPPEPEPVADNEFTIPS